MATSSVEAEILLKVRCPPHTIEKSCQFFMLLTHAFESRFIQTYPSNLMNCMYTFSKEASHLPSFKILTWSR
jgi:hypothetical protein